MRDRSSVRTRTLAVLLMVVATTDREAARRAVATPLDFLTKVAVTVETC